MVARGKSKRAQNSTPFQPWLNSVRLATYIVSPYDSTNKTDETKHPDGLRISIMTQQLILIPRIGIHIMY